MADLLSFILNFDQHLATLIAEQGAWTYGILGAIVFAETGLVVTPFLPGDSLLFAAGAFAATDALEIGLLFLIFLSAVFAGDNVNYWVGRTIGAWLFRNENSKVFRRSYLNRTHRFYEKYGRLTVILARFVPIVRTFSPFVAGLGAMRYPVFLGFSILGSILWTGIFVGGGYFFGNIAFVRDHFSLVVVAIIVLSVLAPVIEILRHRLRSHTMKPRV